MLKALSRQGFHSFARREEREYDLLRLDHKLARGFPKFKEAMDLSNKRDICRCIQADHLLGKGGCVIAFRTRAQDLWLTDLASIAMGPVFSIVLADT